MVLRKKIPVEVFKINPNLLSKFWRSAQCNFAIHSTKSLPSQYHGHFFTNLGQSLDFLRVDLILLAADEIFRIGFMANLVE